MKKNKKKPPDLIGWFWFFMLLGVLRFYTFPLPSNRNLALNKDENQNNANKDEGGKKVHQFL
jgi:hypothetical protein